MTWTPEIVAECKGLWLKHRSGTEIALILSAAHDIAFTKNSVICKMARLGLSGEGGTRARSSRPIVRRQDLPPAALEALRERERERERKNRARRRELRGLPPIPEGKDRPAPIPRPAAVVPARVPAVAAPRPQPSGILPSLDIPLTDTRDGQCRFIAIDPLTVVPAPCCGQPTVENGSWCQGDRLEGSPSPARARPEGRMSRSIYDHTAVSETFFFFEWRDAVSGISGDPDPAWPYESGQRSGAAFRLEQIERREERTLQAVEVLLGMTKDDLNAIDTIPF